jgi:aminoglycoside 6-adenylyltransferase
MKEPDQEQKILKRLIQWAGQQESIRAMLLYSSRANSQAPVDVFSDYDILLAVTDVQRFHEDDGWLEDFGRVLVVFRNPIGQEHGFECFGFITHYQEGVKIDYSFYPADYLTWAASQARLPDDLDNGYLILLDKDRLTEGLQPPTYHAYLPAPPSEAKYRAVIDEFFNDAIYVAKHLWRDNLFSVKLSLDHIMKFNCLRQMLEWRMGIDKGWSVKPGAYGKGLKRLVEPETWVGLEATYVGAGRDENWQALFKTIELFRQAALEVGERLGYEYPVEMDQQVVAYLESIQSLARRDS